jgi:hypothetical protein
MHGTLVLLLLQTWYQHAPAQSPRRHAPSSMKQAYPFTHPAAYRTLHGCNIIYLHAPNHRPRTHDLPHPGWPASARPSTRSTLAVRQVRRTTRAITRCECHSLSGHVAIPLALQQGWRASRCAFPFQGTVSEMIDRSAPPVIIAHTLLITLHVLW